MQILYPNNIKIYNLSSGKSIPEWLSDRKRRLLMRKSVDLRKRIELIQDFQMPAVSSCIRLSNDGQYIAATGIYKPRVRCYDVNNLAMKFERCFDSEVVTFEILSEDYSKMVFLRCDRYIEFHSAEGRYYRLRMPSFGHDMKFHPHTCDLYLVGASSHIYRLNLERGQFISSLTSSQSTEMNKVVINPCHGLVLTGGVGGKLEAYDPRSGICVNVLDCALATLLSKETNTQQVPDITALNYKGNLTCAVGMSTGQVLLYDIRANKPYRIKDHMYELPIRDVQFLNDYILSMDSSILKIWNEETSNLLTSIDAGSNTLFNNLCIVPNSGMFFIANENTKIQTYYIPNLGPAPKWCGFLDALTEELEETNTETVYDDYKFVTEKQLDELGLRHLIGTDLLRAYMHGYFIDIRLYRKAKSVAEPFNFEKYKNKKIKEKLNEEKSNRVQIQLLPSVNKDLALKLMADKERRNKRSRGATSILKDERFNALFENPQFEVDPNAEEYRLLTPVLKRLDSHLKNSTEQKQKKTFELGDAGSATSSSSDDSSDEHYDETEEKEETAPVTGKVAKVPHRKLVENSPLTIPCERTKFYTLNPEQEIKLFNSNRMEDLDEDAKKPLGERIEEALDTNTEILPFGNRSYSFVPSESNINEKRTREQEKHRNERKKVVRLAPKPKNPKFR